MTAFVLGLFLGAAIATLVLAMIVGAAYSRELADRDDEIDRLRMGLKVLLSSSRDATSRRFIARLLDPDGEDAGS